MSAKIKYSKSSGDISLEGLNIAEQEKALQKTIADVTSSLGSYPERKSCIVCDTALGDSDVFQHRGLSFRHCRICGHIQTFNLADESYEKKGLKALGYEGIYPDLDAASYNSRCSRIYAPKADWIVESLTKKNIDPASLKWCEIGCGAGYFLKVLQDKGYTDICGFDIDEHNLRLARNVLGNDIVRSDNQSFDRTLASSEADIYVSFFVLEHIADTYKVIESLKQKPSGTMFAFSVPVFGFITMFESIIEEHYPRSLDAMMHTQIYTDESLDYFLEQAGYVRISEWVFGQDMMDIHRFMRVNLADRYADRLYNYAMGKLGGLVDPMQNAIDKAHFADARHILAVKT